jgi:hypothetical protein
LSEWQKKKQKKKEEEKKGKKLHPLEDEKDEATRDT